MSNLFKKLKSGKLNLGRTRKDSEESENRKKIEENLIPGYQDTRVENAKFLGSVVAPCSMSTLSNGERYSTIYAAVTKAIGHNNRKIDPSERRIQLHAEAHNLIDCIVDSPHIDKNCDVYLTKDGIQIFEKGGNEPIYDHCLTCISSAGTRIPYRDNVFVYCAQLALNVNNTTDMKIPGSLSRQIFVLDFEDPASTCLAYTVLNKFFKKPHKY